jgi:hypothetical protein
MVCSLLRALRAALALDVRHGEPELAGGVTGVVDREDVGMLEPGGGADLPEEPLRAQCGAELGVEDLEGDQAIVLEVVGEVDRSHAAPAELALDHIAVAESFSELDGNVGHDGGLTEGPRNLGQRTVARQPLGAAWGCKESRRPCAPLPWRRGQPSQSARPDAATVRATE